MALMPIFQRYFVTLWNLLTCCYENRKMARPMNAVGRSTQRRQSWVGLSHLGGQRPVE